MRPLGKVGVEERHYWVGDTPSGPYSRPYQLITPSPHQHPIVCQGRTGGQSVGGVGAGKGRGQGQWEPWGIYCLGNGRHRSEVPELEDWEAVHCPLVSQVWGQRAYLAPGSYSDQILLNSSR